MPLFFLIFIVIPLIEIFLFAEVGDAIGGWNTVALVIITAVVGAWCVRTQGLSTLLAAQQKLHRGQIPAQEAASGIAIVLAGVLLIVPGFLTDFIGFMLLVPPIREMLWGFFKFQNIIYTSSMRATQQDKPRGYADEEDIIDGDFEVLDEKDEIPHKK